MPALVKASDCTLPHSRRYVTNGESSVELEPGWWTDLNCVSVDLDCRRRVDRRHDGRNGISVGDKEHTVGAEDDEFPVLRHVRVHGDGVRVQAMRAARDGGTR